MIIELLLNPYEAELIKEKYGWQDPDYPEAGAWPNRMEFVVQYDYDGILEALAKDKRQPSSVDVRSLALNYNICQWHKYQLAIEREGKPLDDTFDPPITTTEEYKKAHVPFSEEYKKAHSQPKPKKEPKKPREAKEIFIGIKEQSQE